jgi:ABC-type uncharacterized transport system ATPase component
LLVAGDVQALSWVLAVVAAVALCLLDEK